MRKFHFPERFRAIAGKALDSGLAQIVSTKAGNTRLDWNTAGTCSAPVWRSISTAEPLAGRGSPKSGGIITDFSRRTKVQTMEVWVRCRKCMDCLQARAASWRMRAARELEASTRTWFGTLTLSAQSHFAIASQARHFLARNGLDYDLLPPNEQFAERHRMVSREITKWLKRVRKESGAEVRYMIVCEAHKSGLPHYHLLIHEVGETPVKHRTLGSQWTLGFTNFKLVADKRAGAYVCKYLSKSAIARVRASRLYGL